MSGILLFSFLSISHGLEAQPDPGTVSAEYLLNENIFTEAPFKQCHAPSITGLSGGRFMAVWFGGTYEGHPDVCIWGSVRDSAGWSHPALLADGIINDTIRYPCWNPVLFRSASRGLCLYYKVGPSPREWWGMCRRSFDEGKTWNEPERLPDGILGPIKNRPVYLTGGRLISPSSTEKVNERRAHAELSDDDGASWNKVTIDSLTDYGLIQPAFLSAGDGTLIALMRSDKGCIVYSTSSDKGLTWTPPEKTAVPNPNSGIDAVTLRNGLMVLVYNPDVPGTEWNDGRNRLRVAVSEDGKNWRDIFSLEDRPSGEFSYPSVIESDDGQIHIVYTDDRKGIRHVILKLTYE